MLRLLPGAVFSTALATSCAFAFIDTDIAVLLLRATFALAAEAEVSKVVVGNLVDVPEVVRTAAAASSCVALSRGTAYFLLPDTPPHRVV
jgi:hypothetical protein